MLDSIRERFSALRGTATHTVEKNGKWILLIGGGAFAFLALANFSAAITVAVVLAAITSALGMWKMDP
jgi:hypothetical protein